MTQPYPLPRTTRQTEILSGDGVTTTFGPFAFKVFDIEDVRVLVREDGGSWVTVETTVAKTTADALAFFTVEFDDAPAADTDFVVYGQRLAERSLAVTRGGTIDTVQLEKELTKIAAAMQEVRRDMDRAVRLPPEAEGDAGTIEPGADDTVVTWQGGRLAQGPSVANVNALAAIIADIATVAEAIGDVQTVAGIHEDVTTAAGISTQISALAAIDGELTDLHGQLAALVAIAGDLTALLAVPAAAAASAAAAAGSAGDASDSADLAELWASEAEDVEVTTGEYSSFHWAVKAEGWAGVAQDAAGEATNASNLATGEVNKDLLPALINATTVDGALTAAELVVSGVATLREQVGGSFDDILLVGPTTTDGSDTKGAALIGGGALSSAQGAFIVAMGADHPTLPGRIQMGTSGGPMIVATGAGAITYTGSGGFTWNGVQVATLSDVAAATIVQQPKTEVVFRTIGNVNLAGGGLANGTTHDGQTAVTGQRALVHDQSTPAQNGIYIVPASGAASRATDMDVWSEVPGALVTVLNGTLHAGKTYLANAAASGTIGTTAFTWGLYSASLAPIAGSGIDIVGRTISIEAGYQPTPADNSVDESKLLHTANIWSLERLCVMAESEGVTTGAGDKSAALAAAMTKAVSQGRQLILPPGTIDLRTAITIPNGLVMHGQGEKTVLDAGASSPAFTLLTATGTLGSTVNIASVSTYLGRSRFATSAAHGLVAGDWVRLRASVNAIGTGSSAGSIDKLGARGDVARYTEFARVAVVHSSTNFTVEGYLRFHDLYGEVTSGEPGTIAKITPWTGQLADFAIDCGNVNFQAVKFTLGRGHLMRNVEVFDVGQGQVAIPSVQSAIGTWSQFRACFDTPRVTHTHFKGLPNRAARDGDGATSDPWLVKIIDGCEGMTFRDCRFAHGGQMTDVTYTPSDATWRAPTLGTRYVDCEWFDSDRAAAVDHAGCMGTEYLGCRFKGVQQAIYFRSRDGRVSNCEAWCDGSDSSMGIWFGGGDTDNGGGFFEGAQVDNFRAWNAYYGINVSGSNDFRKVREMQFNNIKTRACRTGMRFSVGGSDASANCGIVVNNLVTEPGWAAAPSSGIEIGAGYHGLQVSNAHLRGPFSAGGLNFLGASLNMAFDVSITDSSAGNAVRVESGVTPTFKKAIARLTGTNGSVSAKFVAS